VPALCGVDLEVPHGQFLAVMGPVGAGKSTLCLALNGAIPHAVDGEFSGQVTVYGQNTRDVPMGQLAMQVGLVFEDVEAQLFNATVADEIAFGLEAMGLPAAEIERRIDLALESVGLGDSLGRTARGRAPRGRAPRTLSGGEQKRLALASVLAMRPRLLVLDEPTSGLDPRGRHDVLAAIERLRREDGQGMTVVMATQDAEAAARFADRVVVLCEGRVALDGCPGEVYAQVERLEAWGIEAPQLARLAHRLSERSGRTFAFLHLPDAQRALAGHGSALPAQRALAGPRDARPAAEEVIKIRGLSFRYPSADGWALSGVDLDIARGEWLAVVGVNGSGKSTLIKHLNGLLKPSLGAVHVDGQDSRTHQVGALAHTVAYLPQNPDHMIFGATVREEVAYGPRQLGLRGAALDERVEETLVALGLLPVADYPPAVLGYGLRRQVSLASVLALHTPVLALDEPTVGLDRGLAGRLLGIVAGRHRRGMTVVMVTHDLRWVARYAQRVVVLARGRLVAQGAPGEVLADPERLAAFGLEPLPVTALAAALNWPPPLPLTVDEALTRVRDG
jgi:energy-coupling factor transporter ATP-binding protein EcfA2